MVIVFGFVASPVKAAQPQPLYIEKHCIGNQTCIITRADPPSGFLVDATLTYTDHSMISHDGFIHEAATVLITTTEGDTTVGHVSWVFVNGEFIGTVTILPGTGALANFHANATIDVLSWNTMDFSFTRSYFVTP